MNKKMTEKNKGTGNNRGRAFGIALLSFIASVFSLPNAMAHCPLCTAGTIIGVGITRAWGWDDSIVGVFVGAMIVSSALWANNILKKREIGGNAFLRVGSIAAATFVLTVLTFYYAGIFGLANQYRIFGIERIIFGTISGAIVSFAAFGLSNELKRRNNGNTLFSYQTMAITFAALILNALVFWAVM